MALLRLCDISIDGGTIKDSELFSENLNSSTFNSRISSSNYKRKGTNSPCGCSTAHSSSTQTLQSEYENRPILSDQNFKVAFYHYLFYNSAAKS